MKSMHHASRLEGRADTHQNGNPANKYYMSAHLNPAAYVNQLLYGAESAFQILLVRVWKLPTPYAAPALWHNVLLTSRSAAVASATAGTATKLKVLHICDEPAMIS